MVLFNFVSARNKISNEHSSRMKLTSSTLLTSTLTFKWATVKLYLKCERIFSLYNVAGLGLYQPYCDCSKRHLDCLYPLRHPEIAVENHYLQHRKRAL